MNLNREESMILEKITKDYIQAIKNRDSLRTAVLSYIKSAIKYREIENRGKEKELTDNDVIDIINKEVKKREESVEMYRQGGREDLASKEEKEMKILKEYLPSRMSEEEIKESVKKIIEKFGTTNKKDFGIVMREVMAELKSKADGNLIKKVVEENLKD